MGAWKRTVILAGTETLSILGSGRKALTLQMEGVLQQHMHGFWLLM